MAKHTSQGFSEQLESRQLLSAATTGVVANIVDHFTHSLIQHHTESHPDQHHAHVHRPHPGRGESYDTPEDVNSDDLAAPALQPLGNTTPTVSTGTSVITTSSTGVAGMGYSDST